MSTVAISQWERALTRERALLFVNTAIAAILSLQILDLGLNRPEVKLTLIPIALAGFAFSYFLEERYRRAVMWAVDIGGFLAFVHYLRLILSDPESMGNYLGILLGILMSLLAFAAFTTYRHRLVVTAGIVFVFFSAATSYELLIVVLFPLFLVFVAGSLYSAHNLDLRKQIAHLGIDDRLHIGTPAALSYALAGLLVRVVGAILALSVIIYLLIPHYTDVNRRSFLIPRSGSLSENLEDLERRNRNERVEIPEGALNVTGFSQNFDLSGDSSVFGPRTLFESQEVAVTMKSSQNGYLRGIVFDTYTGRSWVRSPEARRVSYEPVRPSRAFTYYNVYPLPVVDFPSRELKNTLLEERNIKVVQGNVYSEGDEPRPKYSFVTQEITFVKDHPSVFFSFYQPVRLESLTVVRRTNGDVASPDPRLDMFSVPNSVLPRHPAGFKYIVTALEPNVRRRDMGKSRSRYDPSILARYTQLPTEENAQDLKDITGANVASVPDRVRNLARTVVSGAETPYEKVTKIYDYILTNFKYTLEYPPLNRNEEATSAFLFRTQEGFCMQFASAMAVMARINGIPARVVAGYAPGRFSFITNRYVYRDSNAHAWVEIYFDGLGWVPFDPTPSSADILSLGGLTQAAESAVNFLEDLFVIDPQGARETIASFLSGLYTYFSPTIAAHWHYLLIALLVLAIMFALWLWTRRRLSHRALFVPDNEIVSCYLELEKVLGNAALPREPYETGRSYLQRIGNSLHGMKDGLLTFLNLYYRSAFSARKPTEEEALWAHRFVDELRAYLKEQSPESKTE